MTNELSPIPEYLARAKEREALAAARLAEAEARTAEVTARTTELDEQIILAGNRFHHVFVYADRIDASTVRQCMAQIDVWRRNDPGCDIEIVFTSPGGSVVDGLALWDYLMTVRRDGHKLTTVAYGMAASMAGILLQAGEVRVMGSESWLMIHEASFGAAGKIGDVMDTVDWVKRVQDRILDIFAARSSKSRSYIKRNWTRKDWWLSSDEALRDGFVDAIR